MRSIEVNAWSLSTLATVLPRLPGVPPGAFVSGLFWLDLLVLESWATFSPLMRRNCRDSGSCHFGESGMMCKACELRPAQADSW